MKLKGLEEASREFGLMREAFDLLRSSRRSEDAIRHWSDFINRLQRVYNKLSAASRTSTTSRAWMNTQIENRKKDDLLQYLHQARHVDEHGIEGISEKTFSTRQIPPWTGASKITAIAVYSTGRFYVEGLDQNGQPLQSERRIAVSLFRLVDIENRGVKFKAPTHHLGEPIDAGHIELVCEAVIAFVDAMLADARSLVT